jgi:peptidoglycan/LPS O-acetylase OafA/YrhL
MDWGPKRPPSVSWAGGLLLLLAVVQLGAFGLAVFLDTGALFATREHQIVTASVLALLALQVLAALGVLRLWRWWRGIAMVLSALGIALQGVNLAGQPDEPVVVGINIGLGALYAIVFLLLARSRTASA